MIVKHFIEEKILLFEIIEEIDHHQVEKIRDKVDYDISRLRPNKVVFDFKGVKFMDSAGIGFILGRYKNVDLYDGKIEIINVGEKIRKIFEMSGIPKIIDVFYEEKNLKQIS